MNTKTLSVFLMSFLVGACTSAPPVNPALSDCPKQKVRRCTGDPQAPTANIITNGAQLRVAPYCIKAVEGSELWFRIVPRDSQPLGTVEIIPKDPVSPHDDWLAASNSPDPNLIKIVVPADLNEDDKYFYGIKTNDKCLDPRVEVIN